MNNKTSRLFSQILFLVYLFGIFAFWGCSSTHDRKLKISLIVNSLDSPAGWNTGGTHMGYKASIRRSVETRFSGDAALEFTYHFYESGNPEGFTGFHHAMSLPPRTLTVGFMVKGDSSNTPLSLLFIDAHKEFHVYSAGLLDNAVWTHRSISFLDKHTFWGGDFDGIPDPPMQFHSFYLKPEEPHSFRIGTFYVDELTVETYINQAESVLVTMNPAVKGNIFTTSDTLSLNVSFQNLLPIRRDMRLNYQILDSDFRTLDKGLISCIIDGNGVFNYSIVPDIDRNGCFMLRINATSLDGTIRINEQFPFSRVLPVLTGHTNDLFGVCTHFGQNKGDIGYNTQLAALAGYSSMRNEMQWSFAEQEKLQLRVLDRWECYVNQGLQNGLETFLTLNYGNPHYEGGKPPVTPEGLKAYVDYCVFLAQHFSGRIKYFEIWNEYNIGHGQGRTPEDYARMLMKVYPAIKEANPDAIIVGGATAGLGLDWLKRVFQAGGYDYLDVVSIIPHFYPRSPEDENFFDNLSNLKSLMASYGKEKPIWVSEIGFPTHRWSNGVSEKLSGAYLVRLYVGAIAHNMPQRIYWYNLQNDGNDPVFNEMNFGLLRAWQDESIPWAAKENFVAVNVLTHKLAGFSYTRQLDAPDDVYAYEFTKDINPRQRLLILWSAKRPVEIGLLTQTTNIVATDMIGNTQELHPDVGVFTVTINDYPLYINAETSRCSITSPRYTLHDNACRIVAGDEHRFYVQTEKPESPKLHMDLPLEWNSRFDMIDENPDENYTYFSLIIPLHAGLKTYVLPLHVIKNETVVARLSALLEVVPPFEVKIRPDIVRKRSSRYWELVCVLKNNSDMNNYSGTLVPEEPNDWVKISKPIHFKDLAPGALRQFILPAPPVNDGERRSLRLSIDLRQGWLQTIRKNVTLLAAVKVPQPMNIDGQLYEWNAAIPFLLSHRTQVQMITDWGGVEDLSGRGYLAWDMSNLYIMVVVQDNLHVQTHKGEDIWKGDSIQLALDFMRDKDDIRKGHHEIGFALCDDEAVIWRWNSPYFYPPGPCTEHQVFIQRQDDKTFYEIAMPWHALLPVGREPQPEELFGFALLINDNDGLGRRGWIEYMSGIGWTKDPNLLGEAVLLP